MQVQVQAIYQFKTIPKLEILVHLYLEKIIGKLAFNNDVFAKINLIDSQIFFIFILVSHNHVHNDTVLPHLILSPTLNLRNNQGCILNLTCPFLLPIAALFLSCSSSGSFVL